MERDQKKKYESLNIWVLPKEILHLKVSLMMFNLIIGQENPKELT